MSLEGVKHIILILSGKGGVGKSSVTTQLALALTQASHSVGILDIDLTGPSIPHLLNLESATVTQAPGGWIPVPVHPASSSLSLSASTSSSSSSSSSAAPAPHPPVGPLTCMSLAFLLRTRDSAIVWRGPKKTAMVRQFLRDVLWGTLDYLLIDTPPGTSDEHISLVETLLLEARAGQVAGAVVVTTPQAVATADVRKELNFCRKTGVKVLGVVENMAGFVCPVCRECANVFGDGGGRVMAGEFGVRFLGSVPVDPQFGVLVEEGRRPVYPVGTVVGVGGEGEVVGVGVEVGERDGVEGRGGREGEGEVGKERDEAPLVEKYRSCSLCPIFQGIAKELVGMIEGGTDGAAA